MKDKEIVSLCKRLRQSIAGGDAKTALSELERAVNNAPLLRLVTSVDKDKNDTLTVRRGEDKSASCSWETSPAMFVINKAPYQPTSDSSAESQGDPKDEGYSCTVKMTKAIVVDGGKSSDNLKFVWLRGRKGRSGTDNAEMNDVPGSWFYKERPIGGWKSGWKGSGAVLAPSVTGMSASVTGVSGGVTGISVAANLVDIVFSGLKASKWGVYNDKSTYSLHTKGLSFGEDLSAIQNMVSSSHVRTIVKEAKTNQVEA